MDMVSRQISLMPTNTMLRMTRADLAFNAGNTNAAVADLEAILKVDPNHLDALLFQAFIAINQKDLTKATTLVDQALERNDKQPQALTYKGIIHMEKKEDEKAIEAFTRALDADPGNLVTIRNRAIVNLRAGKLNDAKEDYEKLQRAYPKSHQVYYGLGAVAAKKNDTDEALKNYELYLKYSPTNALGEAAEERKTVEAKLKEMQSKK